MLRAGVATTSADVLQICPTRMLHHFTPPPPVSSLGPLRCRREAASPSESPSSRLVDNRFAVSEGERRNQWVSTAVSPVDVCARPFSFAGIKSS